jgi:hypothetical protein
MTHHEHDTCHKCGGTGIFLGSQEVGYGQHGTSMWLYDYECEDCQATWDVSLELTPVSRENHES